MKSDKKDALFLLVKSLSGAEKRQFSLYVSRIQTNKNANFMQLFYVLEKMKTYDKKIILQKTQIQKPQISNTKKHLYKQIMVSLRSHPNHKNVRFEIRELLDFATILYNKGLYEQSLKMLQKTKNKAKENQEPYLTYQVIELEKTIESQYITSKIYNRLDFLMEETQKIGNTMSIERKLSDFSLALYSRFLKCSYVKDATDFEKIKTYYQEKIPKYDFKCLDFRGKMFLYQANLWFSFITQDFRRGYQYSQKLIWLFEENEGMKKLYFVFYLKSYNYTLDALFYAKKSKKFAIFLSALENITDKKQMLIHENAFLLSEVYLYLHKINLCYLKGDFSKGIFLVPAILFFIKNNALKINHHHILLLYYKIACLYFGLQNYEKTLFFLEKIIFKNDIKIREDLLCYARILYLITHYEMGLDSEIDELIKATYKFLIKMKNLYQVQQKMIAFLRETTKIYPNQIRTALKNLYKELKTFEQHPYEKRAFFYLDILSWLESHIENISISKIIQRKIVN